MDKQIPLDSLNTAEPYEHSLSHGRLTTMVTRAGAGYVRYEDLALTRWAPDPTRDADGYFIYVRDLEDHVFWSLGHQPVQRKPEHYATHFGPACVTVERLDREIEAVMDVCIAPDDVDLRRLTLTNRSQRARQIELTSYAEMVLSTSIADAAHPAFSKLFVQTEWLPEHQTLLARRRLRSPEDKPLWLAHTLTYHHECALEVAYETDRMRFIGRGRTLAAPQALAAGTRLSGTVGSVLDAIVSLRCVLDLAPGGQAQLTFVLSGATNRKAVLRQARRYRDRAAVDQIFAQQHADETIPFQRAAWSPERVFDPVQPTKRKDRTEPSSRLLNATPLRFDNGYGGFSEDGREYVIRVMPDGTPGMRRPPLPWTNVIANETHGFLVTESGAGYTWSINSRENRLTPWYNDPVTDSHGEALYLRDEESGLFWSPTPGPVPGDGAYEVRHGFGYTRFDHQSQDLEQEVVQFVPRRDPVKITRLRLTNQSDRPRRLSVFAYHRLVMGGLPYESGCSVVTAYDDETGAVLARNAENALFETRVTFCAVATSERAEPVHHTGDRTAFLGRHGNLLAPAALCRPEPLDGKTGADLDPCIAFQLPVVVESGETVTCLVLLGQGNKEAEAQELVNRYRDEATVEVALSDVRAFWTGIVSKIQIKTPVPEIDLMVNGWLVYQNLSCRMWGRSAYYQSGGAFGFRDQLQDAAALVYQAPHLTRAQILRHAAHQFIEGDVMHWWHPPESRGIRTRFTDDLLWLPYVTAFYIQTTGDAGVLDEDVRFLTAQHLEPDQDEAFLLPEDAGQKAPIYEHCCRALDRSLTRGPHDLPLIGSGDWNDGMNRVGRHGCGESVWLGFFLHHILGDFIPFCSEREDAERIIRYEAHRAHLKRALNDAGWDGAWYRRAYYDDGTPLGSARSDECQIDAIAQAWAVLSGAAPDDRAHQALDALEKRLISEEEGIIRLLTPPFDQMSRDPGYIKGYVPGVRENGGQYTHGALWAVQALAKAGRGDRTGALLTMLSPIHHARTPDDVATYKVEPYVIAADVYGVAPHVGRGGWTWYTGSAGWMYRVALESLLGLRLMENRYFLLKPSIPHVWPAYSISYRVDEIGTTYFIRVRNPDGYSQCVKVAFLDGASLAPEEGVVRIPIVRDGKAHRVELYLGDEV